MSLALLGASSAAARPAGTPILKSPTSTSVACSPSVLSVGSPTTCTATVSLAEAPSGPTGTVSFASNVEGRFESTSCTLVAVQGKRASSCHVTYTPLVTGNNRITASYGGDALDLPSQGSTVVEAGPATVEPTVTSLSCSPNPLKVGSAASCTATVIGERVPAASGTVSFKSSAEGKFSSASCTLVPAEGKASASCQVTYTPASTGNHTITASYGGDTTHRASQGSVNLEAGPALEERMS